MRTVLYVSVLRSMEDLLSNAPSEADLTNMIFYITSNSMIRIFNHNHTIIIYHPFYSFTSVTMIHYCSYSTMYMHVLQFELFAHPLGFHGDLSSTVCRQTFWHKG